MSKTREELESMTLKQLRAHAKEIGCCLGYDGSRKDTCVGAILVFQERGNQGRDENPWRGRKSMRGGRA